VCDLILPRNTLLLKKKRHFVFLGFYHLSLHHPPFANQPEQVINSVTYSLLDWATNLASDRRPAWVQSVSYGNDEVQQVSKEYM
jgi:hypothetical protein